MKHSTTSRLRSRGAGTATALVLGGALFLTGCGGGVLDNGGEGDDGDGSKNLSIGVSYPTDDSTFFNSYLEFIKEGGQQLDVKINAVAANASDQKRVSDVQNLISQGIDGLVLTPNSTAVAPQILKLAQDADVKVVVVDRSPEYVPGEKESGDYVGFVGPNDVLAGEQMAETLAEFDAPDVLALGGPQGTSVAEGRKEGLENVEKKGEVKVVQYQAAGFTQEDGLSNFENMLQANPAGSANGVWCYNDDLCMGAIKAAKNAGRDSDLQFVGMDLSPQGITAIENGSYAASYGGHWLAGGFGLVMLYDALNGIEPKHPEVKLDLLRVDESNVEAFKAQYIDQPADYDFKELSQVTNPDATGEFAITLDGSDGGDTAADADADKSE
ncbi:MAG: substrate-binding domain-containing protein [Leucobacter sp.]